MLHSEENYSADTAMIKLLYPSSASALLCITLSSLASILQ